MGCVLSSLCKKDEDNAWSALKTAAHECAYYVCNACDSECDLCGASCKCHTYAISDSEDD